MRVHVTWKRLSELKTQAIWIIQSSPSHFEQEGWEGSPRPSENLWTIAQDVIMLTEQPPQKRYCIFHAILQHCIVFRAYSRATGTLNVCFALLERCYRGKIKRKDRKWWEPFWVLLCIEINLLCGSSAPRYKTEERCIYWHGSSQRELWSSLCGYAALAAAWRGADRTAHAQFRRGLWFRVGLRLRCVVICGPALGLSIPVPTGVIAPGLRLTLLLTSFQPEVEWETGDDNNVNTSL